jgi:hypothetical protein
MPRCKNESNQKVYSSEVISGVNIGQQIFHTCSNHTEKDIDEQAKKFFEAKAAIVQIANPMQGIKVHKNQSLPAK